MELLPSGVVVPQGMLRADDGKSARAKTMGSSLIIERLNLPRATARGSIAFPGMGCSGTTRALPSQAHAALIHAAKLPHWRHSCAALHRHSAKVGWREMPDREFDPAPQPLPDG